jgi:hypothetical protein
MAASLLNPGGGLWITCLALEVVEIDVVAHVLLAGVHQRLVVPALQLADGQRLGHQAAAALAGQHLLAQAGMSQRCLASSTNACSSA